MFMAFICFIVSWFIGSAVGYVYYSYIKSK